MYPSAQYLLSSRAVFAPALIRTGIDYARPLFVKIFYNSQNMYKA